MIQSDWNDLRLFLLFLRTGSTRRAAEVLGISHSTVARRLDALSSIAEAPLYLRINGKLQVTNSGQEILNTARNIEEEMLSLERRAFGKNQELSGPVVLSTGDVLSGPQILDILNGFRRKHPNVDLRLITSFSLSDLDRREADLALRFGESPSDHLIGRKLTHTARAIYASHEYFKKLKADPAFEGAGWISFSPDVSSETWKKSTPFRSLPTNIRITDMRTQQVACRSGLGIVMLPCVLCDPDPELVRISEPEFVPRQDLWLLRHAELRDNAKVRALSDHIAAELPSVYSLLRGEAAQTKQI